MKPLARPAAALTAAALALAPGPAQAWGAKGHQLIGAIAQELLTPEAAAQVHALLGHDLATAAVWADCARDVGRSAQGVFRYRRSPYTPPACHGFETAAHRARLEDYARRNWENCLYAGRPRECHLAFHFTNVAVQRGRYDASFEGAGAADVVHAIRAATTVLEGRPAPAPFDIRDRREAVLMLAHFVGDLHQPLHVGSVYLDAEGDLFDPDATPGPDRPTETRGGNSLKFGSGDRNNLHSDWDAVAASLGTSPGPALLARAARATPTPGALADRPRLWATESIEAARTAFVNLDFEPTGPNQWRIAFASRPLYVRQQRAIQEERLVLAGARLAEILNATLTGPPPTPAAVPAEVLTGERGR